MKYLLLLLIISCGKNGLDSGNGNLGSSSPFVTAGACSSSPYIGQWKSTFTNMTLELRGDCQYLNNFCGSAGTFPPNVLTNNGQLLITVTSRGSSVPSYCPQLGLNQCYYAVDTSTSPNTLTIQCGNVTGSYTKQ